MLGRRAGHGSSIPEARTIRRAFAAASASDYSHAGGRCQFAVRGSNGQEADLFRREPSRSVVSSAQRKPRLSFRLPGSFLLRVAARTFLALLFQEPPRMTRSADASTNHRVD